MIAILVLVPDTLERWTGMEIGRVIGWALASGTWVVTLGPSWQRRVGPLARFGLQFVLWVSAALIAIWISEQARVVFAR
jgi:hypothetical protein